MAGTLIGAITGYSLLAHRLLDPTLRLSNLKDWILLLRPQDLERLQDGLKRAGLS